MKYKKAQKDLAITMLVIVIVIVVAFGIAIYTTNVVKERCEKVGGDYDLSSGNCYKSIDGQYYGGYGKEINGEYVFIINN